MGKVLLAWILVVFGLVFAACGDEGATSASPPASVASPAPPTATPTPSPTVAPMTTPTRSPTVVPPATPIPSPTAAPMATPTPSPTAAPMATPTPSPTVAPTATPTPSLFPLTVIGTDGMEVTFQAPPQRIVAYDAVTVEMLYAMGEGDRVVGTHDFVQHPPEVEGIPKVGGYFDVNIERIVELGPDLINIWFSSAVPDLQRLGVDVLYLDEPDSLADISERMRVWGRITGNVEGAEKVALSFEGRLGQLVDRLESIEEGPRIFHDASDFYTPGPDTLVGQVYTLLKAQNIAHDVSGYQQLSPEIIIDRDPQIIITTHPDRREALEENPAFQDISAVREGKIFAIDGDMVSVAGPRYVDAIEELARLIHPELFQ